METATKEQFDQACRQMAELKDLVEKKSTELDARIPAIVAEILKAHPGRTPQRKIKFADGEDNGVDEIFGQMPKELALECDRIWLASKILERPVQELKMWKKWRAKAGEFTKALDTATGGEGQDWVPTGWSQQLIEKIHLQLKVAALFPAFDMPTNPFTWPSEIGDIDSFGFTEATADTSQTIVDSGEPATALTDNQTWTAYGHATKVLTSKELTEDSIVAILPFLQNRIVKGLAMGREDIILNGDTAGSHQDTDVETLIGSTKPRHRLQYWLGLRATAVDQSYTTDLSTFTTANLRAQRAKMGVYGVAPADMAYLCSIRTYVKNFLGLAEVITMDKYGANATVLSGELAKFDGIPIIVTEFLRDVYGAAGFYDTTASTKSALVLANRNGHWMGNRRGINTQLLKELFALSNQYCLLCDERFAWRDAYLIASNRTVDLGINIS